MIEWFKEKMYNLWDKTKAFFDYAETIFFARLQMAAGAVGAWLMWLSNDTNMQTAIQGLFQAKYVPFWVLGSGIVFEILRRRNATDL